MGLNMHTREASKSVRTVMHKNTTHTCMRPAPSVCLQRAERQTCQHSCGGGGGVLHVLSAPTTSGDTDHSPWTLYSVTTVSSWRCVPRSVALEVGAVRVSRAPAQLRRRRGVVVRSELVQRGRGWRLRVRFHLFRHGEVGNTQIPKTAPRAPGLKFLVQNSMACTKVGLVHD